MKVVPPTCRPIFIYIPHLTPIKDKLAKFATMAIRAAMAQNTENDSDTQMVRTAQQAGLRPSEFILHINEQFIVILGTSLCYTSNFIQDIATWS